jgi:serine/threonine protein kinase
VVPELGTILGSKYRILRVLGEGGMGVVYEAENVLTLKRSAIKWLHPQIVAHEEAYSRVLHEARASARIRHHNVVDVYDVVSDGDSICLVMELLMGEPLSALIARGGLTMDRFLSLLIPAMRGVAAAHEAGVIHRDIKPENIFLVSEPGQRGLVPKVIDFGISKVIDPALGAHLTRSGVTMGTPKYVSYEQLAGARDVDVRADVYAMGVILYEALVGRPPYEAQSFGQQAIRFATTVPTHVGERRPDTPIELAEIVMRTIAREREQRFPSMNALIDVLEPYALPEAYVEPLEAFPRVEAEFIDGVGPGLTTTPAVTTPPPSLSPSARQPRPSPPPEITHRERLGAFTRGALAVLPLVLLGTLFLWWQGSRSDEPPPAEAPATAVAAPAEPPVVPPSAPPPIESFPPVLPPANAPELVAEPSDEPAVQRAQRKPRDGRGTAKPDAAPRHPMELAEGVQRDGGVANANTGGAREAAEDDDGVHRAGRVTRDQF